ncbi:TonB-dependent receptor domain-containing protein [Shewanella avicenniae]|nr:TonB-dependent receptor [Shewanella avicenniae]
MNNSEPKFKIKKTARSVIASLLAAASATSYAQDVADDSADKKEKQPQEKITVVGSRIAGAYVGDALPVSVIGTDEIEAIGAVSGDELFRSIPQFGDVSFNQSSGQTSSNFARGDVGSVDLRNLGVGSTLVLINGRRGVNYPSSQASGTFAPVLTFNSNTIPMNGVKRVEILRDGAGAIYGSDAVAGVVNIVLNDDFEGAKVEAQYGTAEGTNMDEVNLSGTFGKSLNNGKGNISLFVNYTDRSALLASDQEFSASGDLRPLFVGTEFEGSGSLRNDSTTRPWGNFQTIGGIPVYQDGSLLTSSGGSFHVQPSMNAGCRASLGDGICLDDGSASTTSTDENTRWDARQNYPIALMPDLERLNTFAMAKYDLSDNLQLFGEASYYRGVTKSIQDSVFSIGSLQMSIPASNYWNPFGPVYFDDGTLNPNRLPGIDAPEEGLPVTISTLRYTDLGPTNVRVTAEQYRVLGGLRGNTAKWDWETAMFYSEATVDDRQEGISSTALQENLALSTPDAYNPFNGGDPLNPGSDTTISSQAAIDAISIESNRKNKTTLFQIDANASTPDLFTLWAGDVGVAVGAEFRRETQLDDRDPNVDGTNLWYDFVTGVQQDSNLYGVSPTPDNYGSRKVFSAYAELAVPLVSEEMQIPLMQSLSMQVAGRYEHYSDFGSVAKPKVSASWVVNDYVRFRGAYSEGFRAPNLEQVNASIVTRGNSRTDWVLCEADLRAGRIDNFSDCDASRVATARRSGNPDLKAEESTNWTTGIVFMPDFLPESLGHFTISADYWSIEQEGIVGVFGEGNALIVDYLERMQGSFNPDVSRREPTADDIARFAGTGIDPVGQIMYVDDMYRNLQPQKVRGIDLSLIWQKRNTEFGSFDFNLSASHLLEYSRGNPPAIEALYTARDAGLINEGTELPESSDLIEQNGNPDWRVSSSLTWSYNNLRVGTNATYVSGFYDTSLLSAGNYWHVDDHTVVNLYAQYSLPEDILMGTKVKVGIRNLFDKQPPLADETYGYYGAVHSPTPRYFYINFLTQF